MKHQHEDDENMNCEAGNSTQNTVFFSPCDCTISSLFALLDSDDGSLLRLRNTRWLRLCKMRYTQEGKKREYNSANCFRVGKKRRLALSEVKNEICELPTIENYRLLERNNGNNNHGTRRHRINKSWFFSFRLSLKSFGWKGMSKAKETFFSP